MNNTLEKFSSCRLINEEIEYIDNFWNGKFSEYVHNSIKRDIQQVETNKNNKRIGVFKDFSLYVVIAALGLIFFLFGIKSTTTFEMLLSYVLGLFMVLFGIVGGALIALQTTRQHTNN